MFNTKASKVDFSEFLQFLQGNLGKMFLSGGKMDAHTYMNTMRDKTKLFYTFCICDIDTYGSKDVSSSIKEYWHTAGNST